MNAGTPVDRWVPAGLALYGLLLLTIGLQFPGTYDAGDSVQHFLYAHWAFDHPEIVLDHWAKPVFTLISSPFAWFGFGGMKLLNCIFGVSTAWLAYKSAARLGYRLSFLAPLLVVAAPEFFLAQFSGLTEPMFAFALVLGVFLLLRGNFFWAAVLLSFLPFIRTEGFLLLPVFALYFIWHRRLKALPILVLGTVALSVIGWAVQYESITWVFTENPYTSNLANYGKGDWSHFVKQYIFVLGVPLFGLFWLGWLPWGLLLRRPNMRALTRERILLIYAPFTIYFGAHMVFWATGTGHSLGMIRVMIAIQPLAAIIALGGLSGLVRVIPKHLTKPRMVLTGLLALYVVLFPILPNPSAIHRSDLEYTLDQQILLDLSQWEQKNGYQQDRLHYLSHPSAAWLLKLDPFDSTQVRKMESLAAGPPPAGSILVWDSWFARIEGGVSEELCSDPGYEMRWKSEGEVRGIRVAVCVVEKVGQ
jgi:hypothetical protein